MSRVTSRTPEEQFALLLDGEVRPDEVSDEARSLYALTSTVQEHTELVRAEFGFRAELREQLITAAEQAPASVWERMRDAFWLHTARIRNSLRAAVASGAAASLIGSAGIAAASQHALPGELLYPVKELTESVRLSLAGDLAASGRLQLRFAEERLEEVQDGAQDLRADLLIDTLQEMDEASIDGAEDLLGWATRTGDESVIAELHAFVEHQRAGLRDVIDRLPSGVVPFARESLELLRRIEVEVAGEPEPCDCPTQPTTQPPSDEPIISAPGEEPAGTPPRTCECVPATDDPGHDREPGPRPTSDPDQPVGEPDDEPDAPDEEPADEPVDVIPELPGPLDPIGDAVDDAVNDVIDGSEPVTGPLPVDPEDDVIDPVDDLIDGTS